MLRNDTIVAASTGTEVAAIAVIRISGPDAISVLQNRFFKANGQARTTNNLKGNQVYFGVLKEDGVIIDEVVVTCFRAPHSYTGENTIEISCHGSTYVKQRIIDLFLKAGIRYADPGEFTMRAFLNGKMDLSQAEAVGDLIASESSAAHHLAIQQLRGCYSSAITNLRLRLVEFAALIELELDFSEEDVEFADRHKFKMLIKEVDSVLQNLLEGFHSGNAIKNGIPIAIVGRPNAGKSTLLNALLQEDRAIVSEIAGTTRDTIEDVWQVDGITFRLIDTAGIRQSNDSIEQIGIARAKTAVQAASTVLYVFEATGSNVVDIENAIMDLQISPQTKVIWVGNKSDLVPQDYFIQEEWSGRDLVAISAKHREGMDTLISKMVEPYKKVLRSDLILSNTRHAHAISAALNAVSKVTNAMEQNLSGDLVAFELREVIHHLGHITGEVHSDELLGHIFSKFCIGK